LCTSRIKENLIDRKNDKGIWSIAGQIG
jgi:hypothetical protein